MMTTGTVGGQGDTWLLQVSDQFLNLVPRLSLFLPSLSMKREPGTMLMSSIICNTDSSYDPLIIICTCVDRLVTEFSCRKDHFQILGTGLELHVACDCFHNMQMTFVSFQ